MIRFAPLLPALALALIAAQPACSTRDGATATADPTPLSGLRYTVVPFDEVRFDQLNPARGDQSPKAGTLWGDRNGEAATGFLFSPVDGFESPPHIHNVSYRGVVIRGVVHNADPASEYLWMPRGSFWTQPKGDVHITSARGSETLAYIEIDEGPYLVRPVDQAFDSGEHPLNVHAANIVWVDASAAEGVRTAFLWQKTGQSPEHGVLVALPRGFKGTFRGRVGSLHAVVIDGAATHRIPGAKETTRLVPGSFFSSQGADLHHVACESAEACVIYARTTGPLVVRAAGAPRP